VKRKIKTEIAIGIIALASVIFGLLFCLHSKTYSDISTLKKDAPAKFNVGNTKLIKTQTVGSGGGEIRIENSNTPIDGFIIGFQPGTLETATEVSISYKDGSFESLPSGKPTGRTLGMKIKKIESGNLKFPVSISFSSDSKLVMGYSIDPDGHLHPIDTPSYNPLVTSYTFLPDATITWIFLGNNK
jgi:hypothetical protein